MKGGPRGLEILVDPSATVDAIAEALLRRLDEAPGFFAGNDVRIRIDGALPAGCLARLDEIATRFELRIVEVGPPRKARQADDAAPVMPASPAASDATPVVDAAPVPEVAVEAAPVEAAPVEAAPVASVPVPAPVAPVVSSPVAAVVSSPVAAVVSAADAPAAAAPVAAGTRMVVGPVRSGVILEHAGNLVVVGDVNPGAEVRAEGNIVVLGRLRGIAHAAIGRDQGFIFALQLEPQQLRISRLVARAGEGSGAAAGAEIAHVTDKSIVVERYTGKLPHGLAAGI
ncbi:MAG: septum site-determining protein MinC [Kofleriaceae bacterium]